MGRDLCRRRHGQGDDGPHRPPRQARHLRQGVVQGQTRAHARGVVGEERIGARATLVREESSR